MKVKIIRTTLDSDGKLLHPGQTVNVNDDKGRYMISCKVAKDHTESEKIEKRDTKEFKGALQYKGMTKKDLQAEAHLISGYSASMTKKELIDLLCG